MKKMSILIALVFFMSATAALAHKVIVFAWVEQGQIHVEGSFGSDRPAKNCTLTVKTPNGILVHQGITDTQGLYSFVLAKVPDSDLILELNAGTGHSGQWTLPHDELFQESSPENLKDKMAQKQSLEKSPSLARIAAGIAAIFVLAFLVSVVKRRKKGRRNA
ncbi:MAG: hypothetical protein KKC20_04035 [Proteobacteria bacterium]|nr:hypothetical protein [Pseudomonadota bacterium]